MNINEYINLLKPLEEIGLIQNIRIENNGEVWFYMKAKIKGMIVPGRIIPGTEFDIVILQTNSCQTGCKISHLQKNEYYTDDLKVLLVNLMDNLDELL